MIKVSVPGKLMIMGEHAVVYGYPCIVSTVNKFLTVEAEKSDKDSDIFFTGQIKDDSYLKATVKLFKEKFRLNAPFKLTTRSEMTGYGFGSSSAVVVGTLKALSKLFKINISNEELFDLSYRAYRDVQKVASGFDLAACIYGNTIYFNGRTKEVKKIYDKQLPILTVFTGIKSDTRKMIGKVQDLRKKNKKRVDGIFAEIGKLVQQAKNAIGNEDWSELGNFMNINQRLLKELGVSTPTIDKIIEKLLKNGVYGAKISGAGGGDCVIVLVEPNLKTKIEDNLLKKGLRVINVKIGAAL